VDPQAAPQQLEQLDVAAAAGLGALQGVAEFLPISSSGHLSLGQLWLGIDPAAGGHSFNIVVHAGTLLAVLWVYRDDLRRLLTGTFFPRDEPLARATVAALIVGTLPLGLFLLPGLEDLVIAFEGDARMVGGALLATAAMLAFSHRRRPPEDELDRPPPLWQAGLIGLAQLFAVLPGISRSGSTMSAALALGMGRARAARFSFLLSIPAIAGASAKELLDLASGEGAGNVDTTAFVVGFATSFVVGLASLRVLLALIGRVGLLPFVPYLLLLGGAAILWG
jgi:undecaprenyl-diphosphatase